MITQASESLAHTVTTNTTGGRTMANASVRTVTMQQALSNAAFRAGFDDVAKRKGWNERWNRIEQWNYERGRMFAAWLNTQGLNPATFPLKSGRWASKATISHYLLGLSKRDLF